MEITRQFNGLSLTIALTPDELQEAYTYQQQLYDEEDARNMIDNLIVEGVDYPVEFVEAMQQHDDFIEDTVNDYRDHYTCSESEDAQLESAVETMLAAYYPRWKEANT